MAMDGEELELTTCTESIQILVDPHPVGTVLWRPFFTSRLTTYNVVVVVVAGEKKKELNYRVLFLFAD